jgi:mRNA interferase MazF
MNPSWSEIWEVDPGKGKGHEQSGKRPGLLVSVDEFNHGPAGLVVLLPLTSRDKGIPWHVEITPDEGGVKKVSYIKCEDIRSVSVKRLKSRWGKVSGDTMGKVEKRLGNIAETLDLLIILRIYRKICN